MDREAINLACEGATEIENGGIGCIGMVAVRLRCKCGLVSFTLWVIAGYKDCGYGFFFFFCV
jgi:hypothetical protein